MHGTVGYACCCRSRDIFSTNNFCGLLNVNWVLNTGKVSEPGV